MDHAIEHSHNGSGGHEHRDTGVGVIAISAAGLVIVVVVVFLLMWGTFNLLKTDVQKSDVSTSPLAPSVQIPPEPRLQEHPWEELQAIRARENNILTSYGWQDQKSGIVRIPIDRAIDMVAQKGLPYQQPGQAPGVAKTPVSQPTNTPASKASKPAAAPAGVPHAQ